MTGLRLEFNLANVLGDLVRQSKEAEAASRQAAGLGTKLEQLNARMQAHIKTQEGVNDSLVDTLGKFEGAQGVLMERVQVGFD